MDVQTVNVVIGVIVLAGFIAWVVMKRSATSGPSAVEPGPAPAERFGRTRESSSWAEFSASLASQRTAITVEPQLVLCFKSSSMAEALLRFRPQSVDPLLSGQPTLIDFDEGLAAAAFRLRDGGRLRVLVDELASGRYGNENVEVVGGVAAAAPSEQVKHVMGLFGAKEGFTVGSVTVF